MSVKVTIVGCGVVGRSMGWYHAKQILEGRIKDTVVANIVDPFLFGPAGETSQATKDLRAWFAERAPDVEFHASVSSVKVLEAEPSYALIACRTADSSDLFRQVVDHGFTSVFLEKPGATTLEELEAMAELAREKGVRVGMGFNKNFARYVRSALDEAANLKGDKGTVTTRLIHCNPYTEDTLPECLERNPEGMLRNMMIHEFALLCTFYGVSTKTVKEVRALPEFTKHRELVGPQSGKTFADFTRIGYTIVLTDGSGVSVCGDRCGGNFSKAEVCVDGEVKFTSLTPDADDTARIAALEKDSPGCMPYFYLQDREYVELKVAFATQILEKREGVPEGMASIDVGVEALRVAGLVDPVFAEFARAQN